MKNLFQFLFILALTSVSAQENLTYQKPPKSILDLADYENSCCFPIEILTKRWTN
jgi:hypothetical protein